MVHAQCLIQILIVTVSVDENENEQRPEFDFETALLKWKKSKDRRSMN